MISNLIPIPGTQHYTESNGLVTITVRPSAHIDGWTSVVNINGHDVNFSTVTGKDETSRVKAYELALAFTERINEYCYAFQEE